MSRARIGTPFPAPPPSAESVLIEPIQGFNVSVPAIRLPLGASPAADNYILHDGALEPRPMLSLHSASPQVNGATPVLGMYEIIGVDNTRQQMWSGQTMHSVYGQTNNRNGWSRLSYTSAAGLSDPPNLGAYQYWDYAQTYSASHDQTLVYMAAGSHQTLYAHVADSLVFSSMTGAPQAKYIAALDNYLMAFNVKSNGAVLVQRAQWSDRGSASSWTGGLSGFEDLLSMKGEGTRVVAMDNALYLFSDEEIWRAVPSGNAVFVWSFAPYDQTRGCLYPWTITVTPLGIVFLGTDLQTYLLPKGGGQSRPIGQPVQRQIRSTVDYPERAWAAYDNTYGQYQLYYPVAGGSGYPQKAVYLDIESGVWMPQSFDSAGGAISLGRGVEGQIFASSDTWGGFASTGTTWTQLLAMGLTWDDLRGRVLGRSMLLGSSKGTIYSLSSTVTSDSGSPAPAIFRTGANLIPGDVNEQKTVNEWRVDYQADVASKITVKFSRDAGASFHSSSLSLPAISSMSESIAYPYFGARYPLFEITSEGVRHRLARFWMQFRRGGR